MKIKNFDEKGKSKEISRYSRFDDQIVGKIKFNLDKASIVNNKSCLKKFIIEILIMMISSLVQRTLFRFAKWSKPKPKPNR